MSTIKTKEVNDQIRLYLIQNPEFLTASYQETANKFNVSYETVRHICRRVRKQIDANEIQVSPIISQDLPKKEFSITDEIMVRRENAMVKSLKNQLERAISDYEQLSDAYDLALGLKTQDTSKIVMPVIDGDDRISSEATAIIQVSDGHFGKVVVPSTVNGLNKYNPDIARKRMETLAQNTLKLIKKERHDVKIDNLVLILGGDFLENSQLHMHSEMTTAMSPIEETLFARELLHKFIKTISEYGDFKKIILPCTRGNHCISADTEVLTEAGWKLSTELKEGDEILAFDKETGQIETVVIDQYSRFLNSDNYLVESTRKNELVTSGHNLVVDGKFLKVSEAYENKMRISNSLFRKSGVLSRVPLAKYSDFDLEFITWIVTDATIVHRSKYNRVDKSGDAWRIQFKLSKHRKIEALEKLLTDNIIPYTKSPVKIQGLNKLQPHYIRVYGEVAQKFCSEYLNGVKEFPSDFKNINQEQLNKVLDVLEITDGTSRTLGIEWSSVCKNNIDVIQQACVTNGVEFKYNYREGSSGTLTGKMKKMYTATIYNRGLQERNKYVKITKVQDELEFVQIANRLGTLITRREGKVNFTGNSRITKKMVSSVDYRMNYETILYRILEQDFSDKMFQWHIPDSEIAEFEVYGAAMRSIHGHNVKYGGGIGGLTVPLNKYIMRLDAIRKASYTFIHHYHSLSYPTSKSTLNGSCIGYEPYAMQIGAEYQPPMQSFQLFDKKRGFTIKAPIFCE